MGVRARRRRRGTSAPTGLGGALSPAQFPTVSVRSLAALGDVPGVPTSPALVEARGRHVEGRPDCRNAPLRDDVVVRPDGHRGGPLRPYYVVYGGAQSAAVDGLHRRRGAVDAEARAGAGVIRRPTVHDRGCALHAAGEPRRSVERTPTAASRASMRRATRPGRRVGRELAGRGQRRRLPRRAALDCGARPSRCSRVRSDVEGLRSHRREQTTGADAARERQAGSAQGDARLRLQRQRDLADAGGPRRLRHGAGQRPRWRGRREALRGGRRIDWLVAPELCRARRDEHRGRL